MISTVQLFTLQLLINPRISSQIAGSAQLQNLLAKEEGAWASRDVRSALKTGVQDKHGQAGSCAATHCEMAASVGIQADPLRLIAEANKPAMGLDQVRKPPALLT